MQDVGCKTWMQDAGNGMHDVDAGCRIWDAGSGMWDAGRGCRRQHAGCGMQGMGRRLQDLGCARAGDAAGPHCAGLQRAAAHKQGDEKGERPHERGLSG